MKLAFTRSNARSGRLILIFAGWSTSLPLYSHIRMEGWDTCVCTGTFSAETDTAFLHRALEPYPTVYLYAWSLGVVSAIRAVLEGAVEFTAAFAVAGTPWPCDDTLGIPEGIYRGTTERLDARNLRKFQMRMFADTAQFRLWEPKLASDQSIAELQAELRAAAEPLEADDVNFDTAYITAADRIFPPENQRRAWHGSAKTVELQEPHFIDLQRIVELTIVDTGRVAAHFNRAMPTYSAHAHAQRLIARRLADLLPASHVPNNVIEIGPGTGLFTALWSRKWPAATATFIDLCDMPRYRQCPSDRYLQGDAEAAMECIAQAEPASVDAILSASAIQWLANLQRFFCHCAEALRPGGTLAVSTFAPGNLSELLALRPDHLRYPSAEELRQMLWSHFQDIDIHQETVEIEFTTPLEALRHLSLTGVTATGTHASVGELRRFAAAYPMNGRGRYSLTFRPLYITARKPR